jgi:exodeoxyribonuclease-3
MKIYSWNINGIRSAAKKGFGDWLASTDADLVGLQEVRADLDAIPTELRNPEDWHTHFVAAERKGYSGVGLYSRLPFEVETPSLGDPERDGEGRFHLARLQGLTVVNCYFPNGSGKNRDNGRVPFKLGFYQALFDLLRPAKEAGDAIVVIGDYNTAHNDIDLARPKSNQKTSGFLPIERDELDRWLLSGWTDSFRHLHPETGERYTWWSQRFGVREKNIGWRIDYALLSPGARRYLVAADIHDQTMGSDHCPISIHLDDAVLDHPRHSANP